VRLRSSEWLLAGYFAYAALIFLTFPLAPWKAVGVALTVPALLAVLALGESQGHHEFFSITRDWAPLGLTLVAYREMDWLAALPRDYLLELRWVTWDRSLLYGLGLQRVVESLGAVGPAFLELCYALVYAVGPFTVAVLYFQHRRSRVNAVLFLYLVGTLGAYALFPFFPSDPPRVLFGATDLPHIVTALRRFNLWLLGGYGIHSSVFPSAHVSSAFSAAWGLLLFMPERRGYGWGMLVYAVIVAIATVYGRYHYAADAAAGLGVSLAAGLTTLVVLRPLRLRDPA